MATDAFQRFTKDHRDIDKFEIVHPPNLVNDTLSIYEHENNGKIPKLILVKYTGEFYISLDLRSANFNSLRWLDSKIVLDKPTWRDLLADFTDEEYFFQSKAFRQKVSFLIKIY
jgi:hypothetical protein